MIKKLTLVLLTSCASTVTPPPPAEVVVIEPIITTNIEQLVAGNHCKNINWKDRGVLNTGFFVAMAKTYAQSKCDKFLVEKLTRPVTSSKDALSKYGIAPTLPNVFGFLVGLAARESSGRACVGRDMSANFSKAQSAESGPFQASLDSQSYADYLLPFFKNWNKQGFEADFYRTVKCSAADWKYWGDPKDDGYAFQKLSKEKPAFQAEYAALIMRENLYHFGPIKRMEVQYYYACRDLFDAVDKATKCP